MSDAPVETPIVAAPQPAPSTDILGVPMMTLKYATLATLLYIVLSSPMMYKLTNQLIGRFAPNFRTSEMNGCCSTQGVILHALVFGLIVYLFTLFDCNGKMLMQKEKMWLVGGAVVVFLLVGFGHKYACNRNPSRYAYLGETSTGGVAALIGGAVGFFVTSILAKMVYDKYGREGYAFTNYDRVSEDIPYNM